MSLVVERCESVIRVYVGNDDELEMNEVRHHNQPQATVQACTFPTTSNVISGFATSFQHRLVQLFESKLIA